MKEAEGGKNIVGCLSWICVRLNASRTMKLGSDYVALCRCHCNGQEVTCMN